MCLLMTGQSNTLRSTLLDTHGLIADIYTSNPDGFGVMYPTTKGLKIAKTLPKNHTELRAFIERLPSDGRMVAAHARWRTHGDVDKGNCHPYEVIPGSTAMAHNGILNTGNAADKSKSDTWHFIEDYLKGAAPDTLHDPAFAKMLGEFIGDNRFAIMSGDGRLTVVNEDQGVEHGGVWYSNTYAWSPELVIPGYRSAKTYGSWGGHLAWDDEYDMGKWDYPKATASHPLDRSDDPDEFRFDANAVIQAVFDFDVDLLADMLDAFPKSTVETVLDTFEVVPHSSASDGTLTNYEQHMADLWTGDSEAKIVTAVKATLSSSVAMAETLCYYCDCVYRGDYPDDSGVEYEDGVTMDEVNELFAA